MKFIFYYNNKFYIIEIWYQKLVVFEMKIPLKFFHEKIIFQNYTGELIKKEMQKYFVSQ